MASLRDQLVDALVARIAAISGATWTARRVAGRETLNVARLALVTIVDEDKDPESHLFYACRLNVLVMIRGRQEDAGAAHGNNPFRYLDELVAAVEAAVHTPQAWPNAIVSLQGHDILGPDDDNGLHASLRLVIEYRHNFADPNTYDPSYAV